jgi:hypothetical protein
MVDSTSGRYGPPNNRLRRGLQRPLLRRSRCKPRLSRSVGQRERPRFKAIFEGDNA